MKPTLEDLTFRLEAICKRKEEIERKHDRLCAEIAELQEIMARLARQVPGCLGKKAKA